MTFYNFINNLNNFCHSSGLIGVTQTILGRFSILSAISSSPVSNWILKETMVSEAWFPTNRNCPVLSKLKCLGNAPWQSWISSLVRLPSLWSTLNTAILLCPLLPTYNHLPLGCSLISAMVDFTPSGTVLTDCTADSRDVSSVDSPL